MILFVWFTLLPGHDFHLTVSRRGLGARAKHCLCDLVRKDQGGLIYSLNRSRND
jgi:hypothetical protein